MILLFPCNEVVDDRPWLPVTQNDEVILSESILVASSQTAPNDEVILSESILT